ncbi:MAG: hypothetical protein PVF96_02760 [Candidatus Bathyarchaeota archaeon]|jgi:hypothetical protein
MKEMEARKKGSVLGTLLRSLLKSVNFEKVTSSSGESLQGAVSGNDYLFYSKQMEAAYLEAERKNAEALEVSRRRFIY